ncbi:MAG: hypothetical protein ACRDTC_25550 [Pseudonocardiaceae bacterium]
MSGPDPDLLTWLALRRVCGGGVAKAGDHYLDRGLPIPGYLADPLAELTQNELVALADADPGGLRRITITPTGQARYTALRERLRRNHPGII